MRKFAVLGTFAAVSLAVGALVIGPTMTAQQAGPSGPDSVAAVRLAPGDSAALKGPRQPVFFRHDLHAGQYKISCQYCHSSVGQASEPGIPSLQSCMGCHQYISGSDSSGRGEIQKLRQFWTDREKPDAPKLEWVRIHTLARHAHFPHMRHIQAMGPTACGTCHGDVARMPQVFEVNNVNNMGFCISCHLERDQSRDCSVCHY